MTVIATDCNYYWTVITTECNSYLAAVIVGSDGASLTYVGSKVKACELVGFESTLVKMPSTTSETELLKKIAELNANDDIDGFIVQLPLPDQIDTQKIIMAIDPNISLGVRQMELANPLAQYGQIAQIQNAQL